MTIIWSSVISRHKSTPVITCLSHMGRRWDITDLSCLLCHKTLFKIVAIIFDLMLHGFKVNDVVLIDRLCIIYIEIVSFCA